MKTVQNVDDPSIIMRLTNQEAKDFVSHKNYRYCPKRLWKEQQREEKNRG